MVVGRRERSTAERSIAIEGFVGAGGAGAFAPCHSNRPEVWNASGFVGRTPWSARDAPVPLYARRVRHLRHGERPARGPAADEGVRPTDCAVGPEGAYLKWHWALSPAHRYSHGFLCAPFAPRRGITSSERRRWLSSGRSGCGGRQPFSRRSYGSRRSPAAA